jgi:hypothetical protein
MDLLQKKQSITPDTIVVASRELVAANLDGEVVILGFQSGSYFGLDQVGAFVWDLIQAPRKVAELRDRILEEYDAEPDQCEQDLIHLLEDLLEKQLIEVQMESSFSS